MFDQVQAAVTVNGCLGSAGGIMTKEVKLLGIYLGGWDGWHGYNSQGRTIFPATGLRPDFRPKLREDGTLNCLGALEVNWWRIKSQRWFYWKLFTTIMQEVSMDTAIPLEKASAELLMIAGEDDHSWDSVRWFPWLSLLLVAFELGHISLPHELCMGF